MPLSTLVTDLIHESYGHHLSGNDVHRLACSMDIPLLRAHYAAINFCSPTASDLQVVQLYFDKPECRVFSPSPFFDEVWYRTYYPDVHEAIESQKILSGYLHFIKFGILEGRWPNSALHATAAIFPEPPPAALSIDEAAYFRANPSARAFQTAFPILTPLQHYNAYGRLLNFSAEPPVNVFGPTAAPYISRAIEAEFDANYYRDQYMTKDDAGGRLADPLTHYIQVGMRAGYSPNARFQEDWYSAFYKEVREAIAEGLLPCGFYHYILAGRSEGRLPRFDMTRALEAKMPGVTRPVLVSRTADLRHVIAPLEMLPQVSEAADAPRTVWFILPTINPDITFGGYRAAFELICAIRRSGREVAILCTKETAPDKTYFLWRENAPHMTEAFEGIAFYTRDTLGQAEIAKHDLFVAYTAWDLHLAQQLAAMTDRKLPYILIQEYEPIFYDNSSMRVICEEAYAIPHFAIFNSRMLLNYFRQNRLGIFASRQGASREAASRHVVFEHKVNQLPLQTAAAMRARRSRVMAIYARPESHAARNLFELVVIALQDLCEAGVFGREWSFVGLGALSEMPALRLGGGHELHICPKMSEADYIRCMGSLDIGISLMNAPHPSVVPFEFATSGALVVTNVYENRSEAQLRAISANIVPCQLQLRALSDAIRRALGRVDDFEARHRNALRVGSRGWSDVFSDAFVSHLLEPEAAAPTQIAPRRKLEAKVVAMLPARRGTNVAIAESELQSAHS